MYNTSFVACAARNIGEPVILEYSTTFTTSVRIVQAIYYILLLICGIFLNTKAVVLIAKFKKLQTLSFAIALQTLILDLLLCVVIGGVGVANAIANQWLFGVHMCSLVGVLILCTSVERTFLMFIFVIDRFLFVFLPFFYPKHKVKIAASLSATSWILSLIAGFSAFALDCFSFTPVSWMCGILGDCSQNCSLFSNLLFGAVALPLTILPIILYATLYLKARKLRKMDVKAQKNTLGHSATSRSQQRATITFFLLFISVFALTLPSLAVLLVIDIVYGDEVSEPLYVVQVIASNVLSLLIITDPIVIMRNRDVREITDRFKLKIAQKCCPSLQVVENEQSTSSKWSNGSV